MFSFSFYQGKELMDGIKSNQPLIKHELHSAPENQIKTGALNFYSFR